MKYPQEIERRAGDYDIVLIRESRLRFTVQYGKQVTSGLTWLEAAKEFGICLFHALECESKIDNCGRG